MRTTQHLTLGKRIAFLSIILSVFFVLLYFGTLTYRSLNLYYATKARSLGWDGKVHSVNPVLGFAPIPNAEGTHVRPLLPDIPMRYDARGFRVPVHDGSAYLPKRPLTLALGGSFTYGYPCPAEEAYPFIVGTLLKGSSLNAGVCGYGLAQMLVLARRTIAEYKPEYVIVQYSPWLVERSRNAFGPSHSGLVPFPFFVMTAQKELDLHPPVFRTILFDLPASGYRNKPNGTKDFMAFFLHVGAPMYVHDDFFLTLYFLKRTLGVIPEPAPNQLKIVKSVYTEIAELCRKHHGKMIVVYITAPDAQKATKQEEIIKGIKDIIFVDAYNALMASLTDKSEDGYFKEYGHWGGSPAQLADKHPNALAHRIIAREIFKAIKTAGP